MRDDEAGASGARVAQLLQDRLLGGGSTLDSASSRIRIAGRSSSARASATRWRCPPERVMPRSPTGVSKPLGKLLDVAQHVRAARRLAHLVHAPRPGSRSGCSRRSWSRTGSCPAAPSRCSSAAAASGSRFTSTPSISTLPVGHLEQPRDRVHQRALARADRSDDADGLAAAGRGGSRRERRRRRRDPDRRSAARAPRRRRGSRPVAQHVVAVADRRHRVEHLAQALEPATPRCAMLITKPIRNGREREQHGVAVEQPQVRAETSPDAPPTHQYRDLRDAGSR